jgi:hypothetical protein
VVIDATLVTIHGFWPSPATWERLNETWRADGFLSPRFPVTRDQAWRKIASRPDALASVMMLGDAARFPS